VDAKSAALTHQPVEEQCGGLRIAVILDEEFLELIDDKQDPRHPHVGTGVAKRGDVLHPLPAEQVPAFLKHRIETLEHARPEFPIALDGDDSRMGKPAPRRKS